MGAGASGQGGFARPRKACWRVFAARRKQALRGGRVRPPGLCLGVAHPRYRGSRAFPRRRGSQDMRSCPHAGGGHRARGPSRGHFWGAARFFLALQIDRCTRIGHRLRVDLYNRSMPRIIDLRIVDLRRSIILGMDLFQAGCG